MIRGDHIEQSTVDRILIRTVNIIFSMAYVSSKTLSSLRETFLRGVTSLVLPSNLVLLTSKKQNGTFYNIKVAKKLLCLRNPTSDF